MKNFVLGFALIFFSVLPNAKAEHVCAQIFDLQKNNTDIHNTFNIVNDLGEKFFNKFGFYPKVKRLDKRIEILGNMGIEIAYMDFYLNENDLWVSYIEVKEKYQNSGLNSFLLGVVLLHYPHVQRINVGALSKTNSEVFLDNIQSGQSDDIAFKATPAYKTRALYGFTEIFHTRGEDAGIWTARP